MNGLLAFTTACGSAGFDNSSGNEANLRDVATDVPTFAPEEAAWEELNPGGGGQMMGIVLDPTTPGRAFQISDMEGINKTIDSGGTWTPVGRSMRNLFGLSLQVDPNAPDRIYAGTLTGLEVSNDGGSTWGYKSFFHGQTGRGATGAIAIDPNVTTAEGRSRYIYVGHGWKNRAAQLDKDWNEWVQSTHGPRQVVVSSDGGESWTSVVYNPANGAKNTYQIAIHPTNGDVYLATDSGVYRSVDRGQNWNRLPKPSPAVHASMGVAISPNGTTLYATYKMGPQDYAVFASPSQAVNWTLVSTDINTAGQYFQIEIDPRSLGNQHKLLVGGLGVPATGLWEGSMVWHNGSLSSASFRKILATPWLEPAWTYDQGWYSDTIRGTHHRYTPVSWAGPRRVWSTGGQGLYEGDPDEPYASWRPLHTQPVGNGNYRGTGMASTYNKDVEVVGAYMIQAQADNGIVQSWDGGATWRRDRPAMVSDVGGIAIVESASGPLVIFGALHNAYGGGSQWDTGWMYGRFLDQSTWTKIGGGDAGEFGLAYNSGTGSRVYSIDSDPFQPNKAYLGAVDGVYAHSNIAGLVAGTSDESWVRLSAELGHSSVRKLVADPNVPGVLYVFERDGLYRGTNIDTTPIWTEISTVGARGYEPRDFDAWDFNGTTLVAVGDRDVVKLSSGSGFSTVLDWNIVKAEHPPQLEPWFDEATNRMDRVAVAGYHNKLFVALGAHKGKHGYAVLRGTISSDLDVSWEDITGNSAHRMLYPRATRLKVRETGGVPYLYVSTCGMGLWRVAVDAEF